VGRNLSQKFSPIISNLNFVPEGPLLSKVFMIPFKNLPSGIAAQQVLHEGV
jgi:hypothetical protein